MDYLLTGVRSEDSASLLSGHERQMRRRSAWEYLSSGRAFVRLLPRLESWSSSSRLAKKTTRRPVCFSTPPSATYPSQPPLAPWNPRLHHQKGAARRLLRSLLSQRPVRSCRPCGPVPAAPCRVVRRAPRNSCRACALCRPAPPWRPPSAPLAWGSRSSPPRPSVRPPLPVDRRARISGESISSSSWRPSRGPTSTISTRIGSPPAPVFTAESAARPQRRIPCRLSSFRSRGNEKPGTGQAWS